VCGRPLKRLYFRLLWSSVQKTGVMVPHHLWLWVIDPTVCLLTRCATISYVVVLVHTVWASIGGPKFFWSSGSWPTWDGVMADPLETCILILVGYHAEGHNSTSLHACPLHTSFKGHLRLLALTQISQVLRTFCQWSIITGPVLYHFQD